MLFSWVGFCWTRSFLDFGRWDIYFLDFAKFSGCWAFVSFALEAAVDLSKSVQLSSCMCWTSHLLGLHRFESLCLNVFAVQLIWKNTQQRYRCDMKEDFDPPPSEAGQRVPFFSQPLIENIARQIVKELEAVMLKHDLNATWTSYIKHIA